MTSRFVSGGTIIGPGDGESHSGTEKTVRDSTSAGISTSASGSGGGVSSSKPVEWEAVQKDLEEQRRKRDEARRAAVEGSGGEKSLYEILQANKAAKQAAFEEQNSIRNQFRALDDNEIDFLRGISDEKRAEEERLRRETEERLANFRKAQKLTGSGGGGAAADNGGDPAEIGGGGVGGRSEDVVAEGWAIAGARKRKREKEREKAVLKGVKRKTSVPEADETSSSGSRSGSGEKAKTGTGEVEEKLSPGATKASVSNTTTTPPAEAAKPKPALGLVDYGSDEDDD